MRFMQRVLIGALVLHTGSETSRCEHRHVTRPQCRCGIPYRNYQYKTEAPPVKAVSAVAMPIVAQGPNGPIVTDIKVFQVLQPQMTNGHCSISRVTARMHPDGRWSLSLRASQSAIEEEERNSSQPQFFTGAVRPAPYTDHLLRNQFCIKIRGYANAVAPTTDENVAAGPPVMLELEAPKFWVQRGQTREWVCEGSSPAVQEFLPLIDRIQVEFSYY